MQEIADMLPLPEYITITEAANIFGGGASRIRALKEVAGVAEETDPSTALIESREAVWLWCVGVEGLRLPFERELPPREDVQKLYDKLHSMAGLAQSSDIDS